MCEHWHIDPAVYFGRIRLGWSVEKSLTTPIDYKAGAEKVYDHLGLEFASTGDMCLAWNIPRTTFNERIRRGWTTEKALTTPVRTINVTKTECVDHKGTVFPSKAAMCKHYGIARKTLESRLELGWTLEEILTNPKAVNPHKECKDHLGQTFPSVADMLLHWGVNETTYRSRLRLGYSLKDALTLNNQSHKTCQDHYGNRFNSVQAMCQTYGISTGLLWSRQHKGWSQKAALSTPAPKNKYPIGATIAGLVVHMHIFDKDDGFYYGCADDNGTVDLYTHQELLKRQKLLAA
jgi:hypothetical protein